MASQHTVATLDAEHRLFVDRKELDRRDNVARTFHPARKHPHPVLTQQEPWEQMSGMTGSVCYDPDEAVFKMWYMAGFYAEGAEHVQCLALSDDAISWRRPTLGLHEALGNTDNNIVIPAAYHDGQDHFETMMKDPIATDDRRYKAIGWSSYDWDGPYSGIYSAWSKDGLNWEFSPDPIFHNHPRPGGRDLGPIGDAQALMIDTRRRRYVAMLRGGSGNHPSWRLASESVDFVHWSEPRPFMNINHDEESLYNNNGFVYGAQYLGVLTHFDRRAETQTQSLQLITSRNGDEWFRAPSAAPLVDVGEVGDWDRGQIMLTGAPPVQVGDELYFYYRGTGRRHNKVIGEFEPRIDADQERGAMSIGLARLRLDGFASIDAGYDGGMVSTTPYLLGSGRLHVNAKCDYGSVRAELLDEAYKPLPGFTADDCIPLSADAVAQPVVWRGAGDDLAAAVGSRPVRVRFLLNNARLYSYWVAAGSPIAD